MKVEAVKDAGMECRWKMGIFRQSRRILIVMAHREGSGRKEQTRLVLPISILLRLGTHAFVRRMARKVLQYAKDLPNIWLKSWGATLRVPPKLCGFWLTFQGPTPGILPYSSPILLGFLGDFSAY